MSVSVPDFVYLELSNKLHCKALYFVLFVLLHMILLAGRWCTRRGILVRRVRLDLTPQAKIG